MVWWKIVFFLLTGSLTSTLFLFASTNKVLCKYYFLYNVRNFYFLAIYCCNIIVSNISLFELLLPLSNVFLFPVVKLHWGLVTKHEFLLILDITIRNLSYIWEVDSSCLVPELLLSSFNNPSSELTWKRGRQTQFPFAYQCILYTTAYFL